MLRRAQRDREIGHRERSRAESEFTTAPHACSQIAALERPSVQLHVEGINANGANWTHETKASLFYRM